MELLTTESSMEKINDQIGNTKIINTDHTSKVTRKIQSTLRDLKLGRFTKKEYKTLYPSDPLPLVVKAHKPEKNFSMRIVVSTIGTPTYEI